MFKIIYSLLALFCFQTGIPFFALGQSNQSETLTITTYYPSPYGVYRNLEVKRGLSIGDITQGPVGSMDNLKQGQLYINSSVILNALSTYPSAPWRPGQVIYYVGGTEKMIKYYNGTDWVNFTGGSSSIPVCGSSNAQTLSSAPATNLCSTGTNTTVSGSGPWTWSCVTGATSASCIAMTSVSPTSNCGLSNGLTLASAPTTNLCAVGTASAISGSGPWTWTCTQGTTSSLCMASSVALPQAICGSSNGQVLAVAPTTNLCALGTASAVSGSGPWIWKCTQGTNIANCIAAPMVAPVCGSSNGQTLKTAPIINLCSIGTASAVSGSGPWKWTCKNGSLSVNCQANPCAPQAHYPAKKCGAWTKPRANLGCPDYYVTESCIALERWGASNTCTYQSSCQNPSNCQIYGCTEACTSDWDGTYSCP